MENQSTESGTASLSSMQRMVSIFSEPQKVFNDIDRRPTWLVPFLVTVAAFLIMQWFTMDIQMQDRIAYMETQNMPAERLEMAKSQMQGPFKYLGLIIGPVFMLGAWAVIAGVLYLASNMMLGGDTNYKKVFSVVAWTSIIGVVSILILTALISSKGTAHGVGMDLSLLLETPPLGAEKPVIYQLFSKFDVFVIWELILWSIGLGVLHKTTTQKAMVPVGIVWLVWIVVSVGFGNFFQSMGM